MGSKKKLATSVAAVATAAAVLVGGTFAWQSISQTALNEGSDVVNPGGRLHNDMWYVSEKENNNDIYVENFAEEPIIARVRLSEYMEVVLNRGTAGELVKPITSTEKTLKEGAAVGRESNPTDANLYDYTYDIHYFGDDAENATDAYWTWQTGGSTVYMPTFNMNKDSLEPDLNGVYRDAVGGISDRDAEQYLDENGDAVDAETYGYTLGETLEADAVYDYDSNTFDEFSDGTAVEDENYVVVSEAHIAMTTQDAELISMSEWLSWFYDQESGDYNADWYTAEDYGNYWVYDDSEEGNGWVYWSAYIGAKSATGLLLDGITLNQVMDDSWYYAIEAEGQFCTPDDTGVMPTGYSLDEEDATEGTGFYANGETVTDQALLFLSIIGVTDDTPGYDEEDPEDPEQSYSMTIYTKDPETDNASYLVPHKTYDLLIDTDENVTEYGDTYVTLSVYDLDAEQALTQGVDYEIGDMTPVFEEDDDTGYVAMTTITILNEDLVGEHIQIKAVANASGNTATHDVTVQWVQKEIALTFYDGEGNEVAGTGIGSTIDPNSEYDFSASIVDEYGTEIVIFSTLESVPVSDRITVKGAYPWVSMNKYTKVNKVDEDEDGNPTKLVVGEAETFDNDEIEVNDGIVTAWDHMTFAFTVDSIKIYESADAMTSGGEPIEICTAYGQWHLYPTGQESYIVSVDGIEGALKISRGSNTVSFDVYDGNNRSLAGNGGLIVAVNGNSNATTVELVAESENQLAHYLLTVGADETATELTVTAFDDNGSGSKTVQVQYLNSMRVRGELLESGVYNYLTLTASDIEYGVSLDCMDYWGDTVDDVFYHVSGKTSNDTRVLTDRLFIGADEQAWPLTLHVTVVDEDIEYEYEYEVYVTVDAEEDA